MLPSIVSFFLFFLVFTVRVELGRSNNLRGDDHADIMYEVVEEKEFGEIARQFHRELRELSSSSSASDDNGIYNAGLITKYNNNQIASMLRKHEMVGFTKRWRSKNRLVLTKKCWIRNGKYGGGYYCVDHQTVCVVASSMSRFYGEHTLGGPCGLLPLDDDVIESLPENLQLAYENVCDGDHCGK